MIHGVTFALTWFNPFVFIGLIALLAHCHPAQMGADGVCGAVVSADPEPGLLAGDHGDPGAGAVRHVRVRDHRGAAGDSRGAQTDVLHFYATGAGSDADRADVCLP
jgi:hypothetical protein